MINLSLQNEALLLKQLDKFYRKEELQWVNLNWQRYYSNEVPHLAREKGSFWWKDILRLHYKYRGVAVCIPNKGDTVGFWDDLINNSIHSQDLPSLFLFAKDPKISFWKLRTSDSLLSCFRIPMTRQAFDEMQALQEELALLPLGPLDSKDSWTFIWGPQKFSYNQYYQHHFSMLATPRLLTWLWKSRCTPKIKLFAWLLVNDRLNTRNILRQRNKFLEEGYNCVLCQEGIEETSEHLFFGCSSSIARWYSLGIIWNDEGNLAERIHQARLDFAQPFFMEIVMIGAWCIWNERNAQIFNGKVPSLAAWKISVKKEVKEHFYRIKPSMHPSIQLWLDAL